MNVKDHEDQEDLEVSEKAEGWDSFQHLSYIAENIGQCKEGNMTYMLYIFNMCEIIIYMSQICTSRQRFRPQL